jgi:hypothetical protein
VYPGFGVRAVPGNLTFKYLYLAFSTAAASAAGRGQYNAFARAGQQNGFTRPGVTDSGTVLDAYSHKKEAKTRTCYSALWEIN